MKTFKEISEPESNTLMIVDALNLAFRWKHSGAKEFVNQFIQTVDSLKKSYKASKVIIACDKGSSSYRKEIFPEYKSKRKEKYEEQSDQERLDFEAFFEEFSQVIDFYKTSGYPDGDENSVILQFDKCEADDIAAYVVRKYKKKYNIWLMSSDKDWDLLIDNTVSRFSYVTRKEITKDTWREHYEYNIDEHISIKCLTGDSGDSVPGVLGIGPVKAQALVSKYGSAYDIASSLPISSHYKYIAALNAFGTDNIIRNYKLMDLVTHCDEALGVDNCKQIDKVLGEYLDT